jgi:hypothetical protein
MRTSPMKNLLLTSDLIGKIKLVEFPNVYKMSNVFLYNDEDIKFCDFLNNNNIIVITSNYEVHLWCLFDYQLKNKFDLKNLLDLKITKKPEFNNNINNNKKKENNNNENEQGKKIYDNTNDHFTFLRDDENIKDIYFIEGNKILLEIRANIKENLSFLCLEVSNDNLITHRKLNKLSNIIMEDNFYLNLDNEREEISILDLQQENNKLNLISKIKLSDI